MRQACTGDGERTVVTAGRRDTARRTKAELAAVQALAVLVHGAAVAGVVLGGPWTLVWFLPALLGSLVAVWCVRYGIRLGASAASTAKDKEEHRP